MIDDTNPATPSTDEEPASDSAVTVAEPQAAETAEATIADGDAGPAAEAAPAAEVEPSADGATTEPEPQEASAAPDAA